MAVWLEGNKLGDPIMIKRSIQFLFDKLGYHVCKKTTIETLRNENEKLKMYYKSSYAKSWDRYIIEEFNYINEKDEQGQPKYKWPGDEWADHEF